MNSYLDEAQVEIVTVDYFRELGYEIRVKRANSFVRIVTVDYFRELGYEYMHGAHIAPAPPTLSSMHRMTGRNRSAATSWWQE